MVPVRSITTEIRAVLSPKNTVVYAYGKTKTAMV